MSTEETTQTSSASRYELLVKIASGGMATVYVGRLRSAQGFWRLVAIKRAHAHLLENPQFKRMLVDEARVASRLHHANVVSVLDVEELKGELRLVMDYIEGASLSELGQRTGALALPPRLAVRIVLDVSAGLHAAHALRGDDGKPLGLVHRDVSPHNVLVGVDGTARIADFGIAKAEGSGVTTTTGGLKGKLGYMAPEYVDNGQLDARSDVFSLGVVAWEAITGKRLFRGESELETLKRIVSLDPPKLSTVVPSLGDALDDVIAIALAKSPDARFSTARAFANALETAASRVGLVGTQADVAEHVIALAGETLEARRAQIRERLGGDLPGDLPVLSTANLPVVTLPKAPDLAVTRDDASTLGGSGVSSRALSPEESDPNAERPAGKTSRAWLALVAVVMMAIGGGAGALILSTGSRPSSSAVPSTGLATTDPTALSSAVSPPRDALGTTPTTAPTTTASAATLPSSAASAHGRRPPAPGRPMVPPTIASNPYPAAPN